MLGRQSLQIEELEREAKAEHWCVKKSDIEFKEKFAGGSGGELYHARWRGLSCVAKTCYKEVTERAIDDLANEIRILSSIRHPNLVLFLGAAFEKNKPPIFLEEYCGGGDLEQLLIKHSKNGNKIPTIKGLKYAYQTAIAMNFLHCCDPPIIHRDLKPGNILLTKTGDIKITDFGLSKIIPAIKINSSYTMTGKTGSYRFMAPEVYKQEKYNEKVDVYSYGMVMYWVFAGVRPFVTVADPKQVPEHVINCTKTLNTFPIKCKKVKPLLISCWNIDQDKRPSFDTIWRDLDNLSQTHKGESCNIS